MDDLYARETYSFMALIELMLSALHGSTISYSSDEKNPYQLKDSANKENAVIETIQKYAYKFCEDVFRYINYIDLGETRIFAKELIKIGISPKLEEAVNFGDIMTENIKVRSLASPRKLSYYLKRPKCLKTDLLNSEWKIGFMKRLFKLNFSYYKIYGFFRKKIMKE